MGPVGNLRGILKHGKDGRAVYLLRRPSARFKVTSDDEEEMSVGRDESALYTLAAKTTHNAEESFNLVSDFLSYVTTALHAFSKNFVEDIYSAVRSSSSITQKKEGKGSPISAGGCNKPRRCVADQELSRRKTEGGRRALE